jgi:hypothetical protein
VLAAEDFIPKFERFKTRKQQLRNKGLKQTCNNQSIINQSINQSIKDERAPHKFQTCGTAYKRLGNFAGHVCTPIADADNNDKDDGNKTEPFMKSNTIPINTECNTPVLVSSRIETRIT